MKPLLITPGEPAGIGPDVVLRTLAQWSGARPAVVVADPDLLRQRIHLLNLPCRVVTVDAQLLDTMDGPGDHASGEIRDIRVIPLKLAAPCRAGVLNPENAAYVLDSLKLAVDLCMRRKSAALVTGPVHKGVINESGIAFSGHTEFLAQLTGHPTPVMMLACRQLRVALVTTHLPLREVPDAISAERITTMMTTINRELREKFSIERPRIFVCGLNPHAGEDGHMGREEIEVIQPALQRLRQSGLDITGPLSADTMFQPDRLEKADVFVAMFHDQGLPVLKTIGFGEAINITLGLPIIRTSVDHGTALALAGSGKANPQSLQLALQTACIMSDATT